MKNTTPAVLWYSQDFISGTAEMTMEERGFYTTLLCYQNIHGHMSREYIDRICPGCPEYVLGKFVKDENGDYYNARMEQEIQRRVNFQQSRSVNGSRGGRPKKDPEEEEETICFSHEKHTETETETEIYKEKKKKGSGGKEKEKVSATAESVISHLNLRTGKHYKPTTRSSIEKISARMNEGFTLDDFIRVIDIKATEWMGTSMEQYLRPETLFGTKFEGYLNQRSVTRELTNQEIAAMLDEAERRSNDKTASIRNAGQSDGMLSEHVQGDGREPQGDNHR